MKTALMVELEAKHGSLFDLLDAFIKERGHTFTEGRTILQVNRRTMEWFKDTLRHADPSTSLRPRATRHSTIYGFEASFQQWPIEVSEQYSDGCVASRDMDEAEVDAKQPNYGSASNSPGDLLREVERKLGLVGYELTGREKDIVGTICEVFFYKFQQAPPVIRDPFTLFTNTPEQIRAKARAALATVAKNLATTTPVAPARSGDASQAKEAEGDQGLLLGVRGMQDENRRPG